MSLSQPILEFEVSDIEVCKENPRKRFAVTGNSQHSLSTTFGTNRRESLVIRGKMQLQWESFVNPFTVPSALLTDNR
jgi:hypothetical protein